MSQVMEKTFNDFFAPLSNGPPNCLVLPNLNQNINCEVIKFLPIFNGNENEDPYTHVRKFLQICSLNENKNEPDSIRLRLFPLSLKEKALKWFNSLTENSIKTWEELNVKFITKFYPKSKTIDIRHRIQTFRQEPQEEFYEAWDRFNELQIQCPHHQIPIETLVQCFYIGLTPASQRMIEYMHKGNFLGLTVSKAHEFFVTFSENSQQYKNISNTYNEVKDDKILVKEENNNVNTQLKNLAEKVENINIQNQNVKHAINKHNFNYPYIDNNKTNNFKWKEPNKLNTHDEIKYLNTQQLHPNNYPYKNNVKPTNKSIDIKLENPKEKNEPKFNNEDLLMKILEQQANQFKIIERLEQKLNKIDERENKTLYHQPKINSKQTINNFEDLPSCKEVDNSHPTNNFEPYTKSTTLNQVEETPNFNPKIPYPHQENKNLKQSHTPYDVFMVTSLEMDKVKQSYPEDLMSDEEFLSLYPPDPSDPPIEECLKYLRECDDPTLNEIANSYIPSPHLEYNQIGSIVIDSNPSHKTLLDESMCELDLLASPIVKNHINKENKEIRKTYNFYESDTLLVQTKPKYIDRLVSQNYIDHGGTNNLLLFEPSLVMYKRYMKILRNLTLSFKLKNENFLKNVRNDIILSFSLKVNKPPRKIFDPHLFRLLLYE